MEKLGYSTTWFKLTYFCLAVVKPYSERYKKYKNYLSWDPWVCLLYTSDAADEELIV